MIWGTLYFIMMRSDWGLFSSLEENRTKSRPLNVVPILYPFLAIRKLYSLWEVKGGPYMLSHVGLKLLLFLNLLKATFAVPIKVLCNIFYLCQSSMNTSLEWLGKIAGRNTIWLNSGLESSLATLVSLWIPPYFTLT